MARREGRVVKQHPLNAMFPYMMKTRTESLVYFNTALDVENLLDYIEKKKAEGVEIIATFEEHETGKATTSRCPSLQRRPAPMRARRPTYR